MHHMYIYKNVATWNVIAAQISSQCRLMSAGVIWSHQCNLVTKKWILDPLLILIHAGKQSIKVIQM